MARRDFLHWFVDALISLRLWLLLIAIAITALAYGPASRLEFDRTIESLFRPDDPRLVHYHEAKEIFGGQDSIAVAYDDPELISRPGLERLARLEAKLRAVPGVDSVLSISGVRRPSAPLDSRPLVEQMKSGDVEPDVLRQEVVDSKLYRGRLISADGKTAVLLVDLVPPGANQQALQASAIKEIREIGNKHDPPAVLYGGAVVVNDVFQHLDDDGRFLGIASSLVLTVVIAVLFRNLRWIIMPLAVVQATLIWTRASLVLSGMKMSMVSSPLAALVTVIGVATVVHVTLSYRDMRLHFEPVEALRQTFLQVLPEILWTVLTTSVGFGVLIATSIAPVRSFGWMMAIGSTLVLVAVLLIAPGVALVGRRWTDPKFAPGEEATGRALRRGVAAVERHPYILAVAGFLIIAVTSLGAIYLQIATDFTENFHENSPVVKSYRFLSDRLGTVGSMDVLIDLPNVDSPEFEESLNKLEALQRKIEQQPHVESTLSVVEILDFLKGPEKQPEKPAGGGGLLNSLTRSLTKGLTQNVPRRYQLRFLDQLEPRVVAGFWNRDRGVARIIVQVDNVTGAKGKRELIENLDRVSKESFPTARTAGAYILLTYVVESLLGDQWITFILSIVGVYALMVIAFRSWSLALLSLAPNVAPIMTLVGAMGWIGLKVNVATAMLASVSMGLSVDFSIIYLYRFLVEIRKGKDFYTVLHEVQESVGMALVLSNLALVAGFIVLVVSSFVPTVHFGMLISIAMLGGLISNLIVLPLLLRAMHELGYNFNKGPRQPRVPEQPAGPPETAAAPLQPIE